MSIVLSLRAIHVTSGSDAELVTTVAASAEFRNKDMRGWSGGGDSPSSFAGKEVSEVNGSGNGSALVAAESTNDPTPMAAERTNSAKKKWVRCRPDAHLIQSYLNNCPSGFGSWFGDLIARFVVVYLQ